MTLQYAPPKCSISKSMIFMPPIEKPVTSLIIYKGFSPILDSQVAPGLSQNVFFFHNLQSSLFLSLFLSQKGDESLEDVSLPSGARALDLSFFADPAAWNVGSRSGAVTQVASGTRWDQVGPPWMHDMTMLDENITDTTLKWPGQ